VNSLANAADYVYSLGVGSQTHILITIPDGVTDIIITDKTILFKLETSSGTTDVIAFTKANVTGNIPTSPGYYSILLNMTEQGVEISQD
jgi:hypothetical protein